ncbi:hypothetical protein BX659_1455 [Orenia metallireducens]|uniref:Uncharacterized protein n=1 Tax=Orenia metallireducens TaxID=1413210 RepID=A0A285IFY3_9FIRM|nr:hypothetical protein [Orenia metallireducens]PRX18129.1 hypothetical protein BX659_1455 [Orenia metallireducens]SNY46878.1 hypothetical protein SAMN06265827_1465 [Orenia metallireducens]
MRTLTEQELMAINGSGKNHSLTVSGSVDSHGHKKVTVKYSIHF